MKFATFAVLAIFVAATAFAVSPSNSPMAKEDIVPPVMPDYGRQGGEDIGTAAVIAFLPFSDTGTTVGYLDDYDEVCPYSGSFAPDVVYSYYAAEDICVRISLCNSFYDTKLFVYENVWTPGAPYACNDDEGGECEAPPVSFVSNLPSVEFFAGNTYYIVVDGYASGSGNYVLDITEIDCPTPCVVECPPEGIDEGEGPCYDGYVDMYNAGCNSIPDTYIYVAPSNETITYCGLSGNYDANTLRDTDWYFMDLTCETNTITACVEADFNVILGFVDMSPGCDNISAFYSYLITTPCEPICLTEVLPPGPWCIFVGVSEWANWPCDSEYVLQIDGYESCVPVEDASWGSIKALYR
jgi:hypothetical protein